VEAQAQSGEDHDHADRHEQRADVGDEVLVEGAQDVDPPVGARGEVGVEGVWGEERPQADEGLGQSER
jgi:hypothetical protein